MTPLIELTNQQISAKAEETLRQESYQKTESLLWELFQKMPENKSPGEIAAKVLLLDRLYATQLFRYRKTDYLREVVENIRSIERFDERVQRGDPGLVSDLCRKFDKGVFSFATKYCCLHNTVVYKRDDYSIYDSSVHKLLPKYAKAVGIQLTGAQIEEWKKAADYKAFNEAVDMVLNQAEITLDERKRKFDLFLWSQRRQ